ncbi:hypothetical protein EYE40_06475 [Glaciihabitans arcticus]|uniref:Uncharacterized protein n=1 Tax=Glaciihabitans arcticus TaxID=2668039 RepID=A0A4Q9GSG3_9MICO|nr:hypothetical protein [Glaciihabitans arcticus]TBN57074.1 hypothetical protein EYE40_06475 [Glaciihabitans arcticus]
MNNDLPRLPSSTLQVVLNLGEKTASRLGLPRGFEHPELDAEWDEEAKVTVVSIGFERGDIHLDVSSDGIDLHYHRPDGESTDVSPFPRTAADALLTWATAFAKDVHALMPGLEQNAEEAAAWQEAGYSIYVCETDPAQLDLLDVEIEGEILMLPWLGAGSVDHQHADGDNHPIELLWTEGAGDPDTPIARAWLDPRTEEPRSSGAPGTDWSRVGLSEPEALRWLESLYLNHHVIEDPASAVFFAALERIAGIDGLPR